MFIHSITIFVWDGKGRNYFLNPNTFKELFFKKARPTAMRRPGLHQYDGVLLFHHNLLRLYFFAIDKAQDIHARGHSVCRDSIHRVSHARNKDAPSYIYNLQRGTILGTNNNDVPIVDKGKWCIFIVLISANGKHQFES